MPIAAMTFGQKESRTKNMLDEGSEAFSACRAGTEIYILRKMLLCLSNAGHKRCFCVSSVYNPCAYCSDDLWGESNQVPKNMLDEGSEVLKALQVMRPRLPKSDLKRLAECQMVPCINATGLFF